MQEPSTYQKNIGMAHIPKKYGNGKLKTGVFVSAFAHQILFFLFFFFYVSAESAGDDAEYANAGTYVSRTTTLYVSGYSRTYQLVVSEAGGRAIPMQVLCVLVLLPYVCVHIYIPHWCRCGRRSRFCPCGYMCLRTTTVYVSSQVYICVLAYRIPLSGVASARRRCWRSLRISEPQAVYTQTHIHTHTPMCVCIHIYISRRRCWPSFSIC
jgi:hypothetical protein